MNERWYSKPNKEPQSEFIYTNRTIIGSNVHHSVADVFTPQEYARLHQSETINEKIASSLVKPK